MPTSFFAGGKVDTCNACGCMDCECEPCNLCDNQVCTCRPEGWH